MKKIYSLLFTFICITFINVYAQSNTDLKLSIVEFPKVIKQNNSAKIKVSISNDAQEFSKNVKVHYAIDGEEIALQNVQLTIQPQRFQEVEFSYTFDISVKNHLLKVWLTDASNIDISNLINSAELDFLVARTTVPQLPLIEEFTSSTCPPCASFNSTFDPFLSSINANEDGGQVAAVKYQMNWPTPGDDPSFNSDGSNRRNSYNVTGIPITYLNGVATSTFNQSVIDGASGESAFKLVPYFYLSGDTLKATGTAVSYTTMSEGLRLYLALTEDFYTYTGGTTSQTTFHYVMRKMLPNHVGTVITNIIEDSTYITNRSYKLTYGNVVSPSFNIWATSAGFTLVSWIQNTSTKQVYQSAIATTPSALSIDENEKQNGIEIFPNPSNDEFTIKLVIDQKADVSYTLNDLTGKLIQQPVTQALPAGKHILQTSTQNLLPGIYICTIKANEQVFTERIVITK